MSRRSKPEPRVERFNTSPEDMVPVGPFAFGEEHQPFGTSYAPPAGRNLQFGLAEVKRRSPSGSSSKTMRMMFFPTTER